jgi:transglycosylase-like protein with SLT domain
MAIPYLACMAAAAAFYGLPPRVLPSIQAVEGGRFGSVHLNADGSADLGVMQVNTRWISALARYTGLGDDAVRVRLLTLPCFNIAAAAAIMRVYLNEAHGDLMQAVGYYHSHTPALNQTYKAQVLGSAVRLFVTPARRPR